MEVGSRPHICLSTCRRHTTLSPRPVPPIPRCTQTSAPKPSASLECVSIARWSPGCRDGQKPLKTEWEAAYSPPPGAMTTCPYPAGTPHCSGLHIPDANGFRPQSLLTPGWGSADGSPMGRERETDWGSCSQFMSPDQRLVLQTWCLCKLLDMQVLRAPGVPV